MIWYFAPKILGSGGSGRGRISGIPSIDSAKRLEVTGITRVGQDVRRGRENAPGDPSDVARAPSRAGIAHHRGGHESVHRDRRGLGRVIEVTKLADDSAPTGRSGPSVTTDAKHGDSIAVNGVRLTVVTLAEGTFQRRRHGRDPAPELLGALHAGRPVTLSGRWPRTAGSADTSSRAMSMAWGGSARRHPSENWEVVEVELPEDLARLLVDKGSITVDGVSLTVVEVVDGDEPWVLRSADRPHSYGHHDGQPAGGGSGQPRGGRDRQVRRAHGGGAGIDPR